MRNNKKVLLGMSGGVDSSVAIILLQEQGYEVEGLTFTQTKAPTDSNHKFVEDAANVASAFNIRHHIADISDDFRNIVIKNFIDEYMHGRTPNPCALCNPQIKFKILNDYAKRLDISYLATGHYAIVKHHPAINKYFLTQPRDIKKDQTYFLWRLTQEQLSKIIFPLGNYEKSEIREIAEHHNITVKDKPDSQEICFIPDNDYRKFLRENTNKNLDNSGDFVLRDKKIGIHNGCAFYTVGQRKGLGLSYSEPLFVKSIDAKDNVIYLETSENIYNSRLIADSINMLKYDTLDEDKIYSVKIRYRDPGKPAKCKIIDDKLSIEFLEPKKSIAIGQSAVVYENDDIVCGGIIKSVI